MKKHVVWQPQLEAEATLNPFVSPERRYSSGKIDLTRAHRGEIEIGDDQAATTKEPAECQEE
jgi:hypothetical protein